MDISGGGSSNIRQATAAATPSAQAEVQEVQVDESAASSSNASNQADARRLSAQEQRVSAPDASADTSSTPKAPVSSKDNLSNALARVRSSDLIEGQTNAAPPVAEATAREAARPVESEAPKAAADGGESNEVKADF